MVSPPLSHCKHLKCSSSATCPEHVTNTVASNTHSNHGNHILLEGACVSNMVTMVTMVTNHDNYIPLEGAGVSNMVTMVTMVTNHGYHGNHILLEGAGVSNMVTMVTMVTNHGNHIGC